MDNSEFRTYDFFEAVNAFRMLCGGGGVGADSRIEKLDKAPVKWGFPIGDFTILVKIAYDVDCDQQLILSDSENVVKDYIQWFDIYYCVYHNGKFKYAIAENSQLMKKFHQCNIAANTKIIDTITETYDYFITDASMELKSSSDFLKIKVNGLYTQKVTSYLGEEHTVSGVTISQQNFSHSCSSFGQCSSGAYTHCIMDVNADDFYGTVIELYNTCRSLA